MDRKGWIDYQRRLPKIDTHEHIPPQAAAVGAMDILDVLLIPYNCDTLRSAGCSAAELQRMTEKSTPLAQRCAMLEPYLPLICQTAFFRAFARTLALEFGEETVDVPALCRADEKLRQRTAYPFYDALLDSMNIRCVLSFSGYDGAAFFTDARVRFVPTVSEILPQCRTDVRRLENAAGVFIHTLEDVLCAVDRLFEQYAAAGVRAVKFGSAYRRTLDFAAPDRQLAQKQLEEVLAAQYDGDAQSTGRPEPVIGYDKLTALDDLLTHHMLALCEKHGFVAVFHTAMHAWNDNDPVRIHAQYLRSVIRRYSGVTFVLLHAGMPYFEEAVLLARYYPNVCLDLTWTHIISPRRTRELIHRILELVPVNKVFAFGGDYVHLPALRGHLELAMENFAAAMQEAVEDGELTEAQAMEILRRWYLDNPTRVYGLAE